jgi:hypothetical protein
LGQQNVFPGSGLKQCFVASTKCFFKPTKYFVALKKVKKTPKRRSWPAKFACLLMFWVKEEDFSSGQSVPILLCRNDGRRVAATPRRSWG